MITRHEAVFPARVNFDRPINPPTYLVPWPGRQGRCSVTLVGDNPSGRAGPGRRWVRELRMSPDESAAELRLFQVSIYIHTYIYIYIYI